VSLVYSAAAINARLNGVVTAIDANGMLKIFGGAVLLADIKLAFPCGTVAAGVLTFTVPVFANAVASGTADSATVTDSGGNLMISGLTVGIPLSGANIIVTNGVNTTFITAGNAIPLISGQIIGA